MAMEQLLGMGFSEELATQALSATGGDSILKATDWILQNHHPHQTPTPTTPTTTTKSPSLQVQPSLDRFFRSPPPTLPPPHHPPPPPPPPPNKRPKPQPQPQPLPPLSDRMRPTTLSDVLGQDHLLGPSSSLSSSLRLGLLPSLLLWGPPGSGKTSIARALVTSSATPDSFRFVPLSALTAGVKDVRDAVDEARRLRRSKKTVLFVDEVHRFNRAQQDSFLPSIEDGSIVFVGATTENPSFHLTTPLLSRCRVLDLRPLLPVHIASLLRRAIDDSDRGLARGAGANVGVDEDAVKFLSLHCDGDARVALNALEVSATRAVARGDVVAAVVVTVEDAKESMRKKHLLYDRAGEEHYNLISALHKSMRGGDPDASLYWLARMVEGGEEPLYIARRLVRFASEDVGLADPDALSRAVACYQACHFIGMPECAVCLAQCVVFLALAPKSVAVYEAFEEARRAVKESKGGNEGVPLHLRNAPTKMMGEFGYGKGYVYTPHHPGVEQSYLPPSLQNCKFLHWPHMDSRSSDEKK